MESEFVIYDFDGVIADTFNLTFTMHKILRPELTVGAYRELFSNPAQTLPAIGSDPELISRFWQAYAAKLPQQPLAPESQEIIARLSHHYSLVIASATPADHIQSYLTLHRLQPYFQAVLSSSSSQNKAMEIQRYLNQQSAAVTNAILVTDTAADIIAAREMGLESIAVAWGYQPADLLTVAQPAALIDQPDQLPGSLEEHFDFSSEYEHH